MRLCGFGQQMLCEKGLASGPIQVLTINVVPCLNPRPMIGCIHHVRQYYSLFRSPTGLAVVKVCRLYFVSGANPKVSFRLLKFPMLPLFVPALG